MKKIVLNLVIFQVGWMIAVLGGNIYAALYTTFAIVIHQWFVLKDASEWKLIGITMFVGCAWDITVAQTQILIFPSQEFFGIPLWLVCLWLLFATTVQHCLRWLQTRLVLAAFVAAVFGPFSYWLGAQISHVKMAEPLWLSIVVISLGWAVIFPIGMYLARKYYGDSA
jgi:hypothetical protein